MLKVMFTGCGISGFRDVWEAAFSYRIFRPKLSSEEGVLVGAFDPEGLEVITTASALSSKYLLASRKDLANLTELSIAERLRFEVDFLDKADGFVFTIDTREFRWEANQEALSYLNKELLFTDRNIEQVPILFLIIEENLGKESIVTIQYGSGESCVSVDVNHRVEKSQIYPHFRTEISKFCSVNRNNLCEELEGGLAWLIEEVLKQKEAELF